MLLNIKIKMLKRIFIIIGALLAGYILWYWWMYVLIKNAVDLTLGKHRQEIMFNSNQKDGLKQNIILGIQSGKVIIRKHSE